MKIIKFPDRRQWNDLIQRPVYNQDKTKEIIAPIIRKVREKGDKALRKFVLEYDHFPLINLQVSQHEIAGSGQFISKKLKRAIHKSISNIEKFHKAQWPVDIRIKTTPGVTCMRRALPIENVGLYIPGGTAPLFSTVLMLGIPARIAGCKNIIICTPCDHYGRVNPAILYSASTIGIDTIFKVGGAQAIAAMAFGTESVPRVDKIFGPGNQYVTLAKLLVSQHGVAIDMPAGPSELFILADTSAVPAYIASDLLSQAEHGIDSQVILVSTAEKIIKAVDREIKKQIDDLPRRHIIEKSLSHSVFIQVKNIEEGIDFMNLYAPEHLIIATRKPDQLVSKVKNAGSVFLGHYTPESAGDYSSGTNHTLPTNGYARAHSGVSVESFMKFITFQKITKDGIKSLGKTIETMAEAEDLLAHKNAVSIRLKKTNR
jgi:histidinol dehydrogenase